jgi:putative tryptophan/tyrosine transport system substrate-binding protein
MNTRRKLLIALGAVAATSPLRSIAQPQGKVWRIGFISGAARPPSLESSFIGGFLQGMRELGYAEGRDFVIEWRFAEAKVERYAQFAAELARLKTDIFVLGTPQAARPVQSAAPQTPVVLCISTDPVGSGLAASLAHPGGTITGIASSLEDSSPKQLELLTAAVPNMSRLGMLVTTLSPSYDTVLKRIRASAQQAKLTLVTADARSAGELAPAFDALSKARVQALMVMSDVLFNVNREKVAALAIKHKLPSMFGVREYVDAGGLLSYGERFREFFRRAASYVDKIIKGAKPGDLPIEQPNRFYLTVNRKTAKALGIKIPESLLLRADEVIE